MTTGPEDRLQKLVSSLSEHLGDNLRSVLLYGSAARGDWTGKSSDLNVLVEVEDGSPDRLVPASREQRRWIREGNPPLLFVTSEWIRNSTDVFPLEFLDMLAAHRVLHGENPLAGLSVSPANLRLQCESTIRSLVLKLRAAYLESHHSASRLFEVITGSYGAVAAVARAALRLAGEDVPLHSDEVLDAVSRRFALRPEPFREAGALKRAQRAGRLEAMRELFQDWFCQVAALARALDGMERTRGGERPPGVSAQEEAK